MEWQFAKIEPGSKLIYFALYGSGNIGLIISSVHRNFDRNMHAIIQLPKVVTIVMTSMQLIISATCFAAICIILTVIITIIIQLLNCKFLDNSRLFSLQLWNRNKVSFRFRFQYNKTLCYSNGPPPPNAAARPMFSGSLRSTSANNHRYVHKLANWQISHD